MFGNLGGSERLNTKVKKFENWLANSYLVIKEKPFRCTKEEIESLFCKFLSYS